MTKKERQTYHEECVKELRKYRGSIVSLILDGGARTMKGRLSFSRTKALLINGSPAQGLILFFKIIS